MKSTKYILNTLAAAILFARALSYSTENIDSTQKINNVDKTRIAILNLVPGNGVKSSEAMAMTRALRLAASENENYFVVTGEEMVSRARTAGTTIPIECLTEYCALEAGKTLAASKIITGEYETNDGYRAVKLKSFDLQTRDFTAKASIAAECPAESLHLLASIAFAKLFGLKEPDNGLKVKPYRGKEIKRTAEWGILSIGAIAGALIYASTGGYLSPEGTKGTLEEGEAASTTLSYQRGAFANIAIGARPHGMGGAFVGLSDDGNALAYNPAGLARLNSRVLSAGYLHFPIGDESLPYNYLSYGAPVSGTLYHGIGLILSPADYGSSESQIIISAAKLFDDPNGKRRPYSVGISAKFLLISTAKPTQSYYQFQENSVEGAGFGFSLDLGAQIQLSDRITAGLLLKDIASTINYTNTTTDNSYSEGIPPTLIIGGHYRLMNTVNLVLDGYKSLFKEVEDHVRLGIEKRLFDLFAIRIGMSQNFSMESNRRYHAGFGIDAPLGKGKQRLQIDYSYEYFHTDGEAYGDLSGSQRFAATCRF